MLRGFTPGNGLTHVHDLSTLRWIALGAGLSAMAVAHRAEADPSAATALFHAAKDLMKEGKIAEACGKFEASYKEDPLLGALLNAADCRDQQGKLAAAWALFDQAADKAERAGDNRLGYAQKRRDDLAPRLPTLTLAVTNPVPGLSIYRGGKAVDPGAFGTALPVDPGETTLELTQGDDIVWQETLTLAEREKKIETIDEKALYDAAPAVKKKHQRVDAGGGPPPPPVPFWGPQRVASVVIGAAGVATAGIGLALGGVALAKKSAADAACVRASATPNTFYCTPQGTSAASASLGFANASQWTVIAGGAATALGLTLFFTSPAATAKPPGALDTRASLSPRLLFVSPVVGGGTFGAVLGGAF